MRDFLSRRRGGQLLGMLLALAASGGAAETGQCTSRAPVSLDIASGSRIAVMPESLAYDGKWAADEAATTKVFVNGAEYARETGSGDVRWTALRPGRYRLTCKTYASGAVVGDTLSADFVVPGRDLANAEVALDAGVALYDGTAKEPKPVVRYKGRVLAEGTDYTLSYENATQPGWGKVVISGCGEFHDEIEKSFRVYPAGPCFLDIHEGTRIAAASESLAYDGTWAANGAATTKVFVNGAELAEKTGCGDVQWAERRAGTYRMTCKTYVAGFIVGEVLTAEFQVAGRDLANAEVAFDADTVLWDGTAKEPKPVITYEGRRLVEGTDYTLSYEDNTQSGWGKMIITGSGDFHDVVEKSFRIYPAGQCSLDISEGPRVAKLEELLAYDAEWAGGTGATAKLRILENGSRIAELTGAGSYVWAPEKAGTYTMRLRTYVDGYLQDDIQTAVFSVLYDSIVSDMITVSLSSDEFEYDGQQKEPEVTVVNAGVELVKNQDYVVRYANNTDIGKADVFVTGIGQYAGTVHKQFAIYLSDPVTVTIRGHVMTGAYTGTAQNVSGFDFTISNAAYDKDYFTFSGNSNITASAAGTYAMGLSASQFVNTNMFFRTVNFVIAGDGALVINRAAITINGNDPDPADPGWLAGQKSKFDFIGMYDGAGHTVDTNALRALTVTTGDALTFTYALSQDGVFSATAPVFTNVCTTSIWYRVSSPNYADYIHEAAVVITNKPLEASMVGVIASQHYTGSVIEPFVLLVDGEPSIITTNDYTVAYSDNVFVGTAGVTVTATAGGNYSGSVSTSFTIEKMPIEPPEIPSKGYTGVAQTADVPTSPLYQVISNPGGINPGSYFVVLLLTDTENYVWATSETAYLLQTFNITRAQNRWITEPSIMGWAVGGEAGVPLSAALYGEARVRYKGTTTDGESVTDAAAVTKAGSYTAVFTVAETTNYTGLSREVPFFISESSGSGTAPFTFRAVNYMGVYDGKPHTIQVITTGGDGSFTISYSTSSNGLFTAEAPVYTDVCVTTVWYRISSPKYSPATGSATVAIIAQGESVDFVTVNPGNGRPTFLIPYSWFVGINGMAAKYGSDWTAAAYKPNGKKDVSGNDLLVWQDYVAGTDPMDTNSIFSASIELADGMPVVTWKPALNGTGIRMGVRTYRVFGKTNLTDSSWMEIPAGNEGAFRFFKVTVEMP